MFIEKLQRGTIFGSGQSMLKLFHTYKTKPLIVLDSQQGVGEGGGGGDRGRAQLCISGTQSRVPFGADVAHCFFLCPSPLQAVVGVVIHGMAVAQDSKPCYPLPSLTPPEWLRYDRGTTQSSADLSTEITCKSASFFLARLIFFLSFF